MFDLKSECGILKLSIGDDKAAFASWSAISVSTNTDMTGEPTKIDGQGVDVI